MSVPRLALVPLGGGTLVTHPVAPPAPVSPINLNIWDTVFAGVPYPSSLWLNDSHPGAAGYAAIGTVLAAAMPDPGSSMVVLAGDSWGYLGADYYQAAFTAKYGHAVTMRVASHPGFSFAAQNATFMADVAPYTPTIAIHASGFINDVYGGISPSAAAAEVARFRSFCNGIGARQIFFGVAPMNIYPTESATMRTAITAAIAA